MLKCPIHTGEEISPFSPSRNSRSLTDQETMASNISPKGRWVLDSAQEGISSLRYEDSLTFEATQIAPDEVLVDIHAASLNYREIAIAKVHIYVHSDHALETPKTDHHERATRPAPYLSQQRRM